MRMNFETINDLEVSENLVKPNIFIIYIMLKGEENARLDMSSLNTVQMDEEFYPRPLNSKTSFLKRVFLLNVQDYMNVLY
jgi:hypothetical protein